MAIKKIFKVWHFVTLFSIVVLTLFVIWAKIQIDFFMNVNVSCVRLMEVGRASVIYMNEHEGKMPDVLYDLCACADLPENDIICTFCKKEYSYFGKGLSYESDYSDHLGELVTVMCDCEKANHLYLLCYLDGHVKGYNPDEILECLEVDTKIREQYGLKPIDISKIKYGKKSLLDYKNSHK